MPAMSASRLPVAIERFLLSPISLLLVVAVAFVLNAWSLPLTDVDEGAFSEATREMMARGNLVSPTLNDAPRHDKPILIYWAQAASVSLLGVSEIGFRLPSIVFAVLWMLALYRFCLRHADRRTAQVAALVMALSLAVGFIAKAAISDALLNLFIALSMFGIYDFFCAERDGRPTRRLLFTTYAMLGLGFLTKGPVAVFFPLLVSGLFFVSAGAWRAWLRALFFWPGWLVFLAIVVPWHVAVYLDQGDAFFRGFYLKHNVNRYSNTFEGHGGKWYYYFVVAPFVLMPFFGWLLAIVGKVAGRLHRSSFGIMRGEGLLERFLLIWFVIVFAFFTFSGTQLPHYLLYGCTPIFILLALYRPSSEGRWLVYVPLILFALVLAALPEILVFAAVCRRRHCLRRLAQPAGVAGRGAGRPVAGAGCLGGHRTARHRRHPGADPRGRAGGARGRRQSRRLAHHHAQLQRLSAGGHADPGTGRRGTGADPHRPSLRS